MPQTPIEAIRMGPEMDEAETTDLHDDIVRADITISGVHKSVQYGHKIHIEAPYEAREDIKSMDWDRTHREWNDHGKWWQIDYGALGWAIETLVEAGWVVVIDLDLFEETRRLLHESAEDHSDDLEALARSLGVEVGEYDGDDDDDSDDAPDPRDVDLSEGVDVITERHECDECGDEFGSEHGLAVHVGMVHGDDGDTVDGSSGETAAPDHQMDGGHRVATDGGEPGDELLDGVFSDTSLTGSDRTDRPFDGGVGGSRPVLRECPECGTDRADQWSLGDEHDHDAHCVCVECGHDWPDLPEERTPLESLGTRLLQDPVTDVVRLVERVEAGASVVGTQPLGTGQLDSELEPYSDSVVSRTRLVGVEIPLDTDTDLQAVRQTARSDSTDGWVSEVVSEAVVEDENGCLRLQRQYDAQHPRWSQGWLRAEEELISLVSDNGHTPSTALTGWLAVRGSTEQTALGSELRISQSRVSECQRAVEHDLPQSGKGNGD